MYNENKMQQKKIQKTIDLPKKSPCSAYSRRVNELRNRSVH